MRTKIFSKAMTVSLTLLSLNTIGIAAEQSLPVSKGLGFGFEPGLVSGKDYVPGQLIVVQKEGANTQNIAQAASVLGGQQVKAIEGTALLLQFASDSAAEAAAASLLANSGVIAVERNGIVHLPPTPQISGLRKNSRAASKGDISPLSVSTDAGTGYQWHHTVIRKTAALPALSATPPTVAVLDTGVDYTHPDLAGKVILGKNTVANNFDPFDDHSHGTHVAGLVGAKAANGDYGEGVCPNCKILAVKVLGADGSGSFFDIADGMHFAHTVATTPPTRVLNMSLGGPSSSLIALEVDHIKAAGKVLVAAAGNSNTASTSSAFPGADPDTALRVMSTESNDCRSFFSNFSPSATPTQYNIAAPGSDIFSTFPQAGYQAISGTSMASPIVAGAAALVWGQLPSLTRDGLVSRIVTTGQSVNCGFAAATKRVDVRKAILGTTENAIVGRILDPFTGKAPSSPTTPTTASLFLGTTLLKTDATNTGGSYEMTGLTTGTGRFLKGSRAGYVNATIRTGISIASVAGPFNDALPKARPTGNATFTLDWRNMEPAIDATGCSDACLGAEFDFVVKLPSGAYIDPFFNPGDLATSPFVKNPRDSAADLKPMETIVVGSAAANGVYKVFADKYPSITGSFWDPSWTGSGASVQFYNGAASIGPFFANPPATCGTNRFWYIANLTKSGTSYTVTPVNTCSNTAP